MREKREQERERALQPKNTCCLPHTLLAQSLPTLYAANYIACTESPPSRVVPLLFLDRGVARALATDKPNAAPTHVTTWCLNYAWSGQAQHCLVPHLPSCYTKSKPSSLHYNVILIVPIRELSCYVIPESISRHCPSCSDPHRELFTNRAHNDTCSCRPPHYDWWPVVVPMFLW